MAAGGRRPGPARLRDPTGVVHDIHRTTVAAVPGIIDRLRRRGYTFVTVEHPVGKPKPGHTYFHG